MSNQEKEEKGLTAKDINKLRNLLSFSSPSSRIVRNYNSKFYGSEFEEIGNNNKQLVQAAFLPTQRTPGTNRMSQKEIDQLLRVLSLTK